MERINVKITLQNGAKVPVYATDGSAGADLSALLASDFVLRAGEFALIPTGISIELPKGYEAQVRPRSGLAAKFGITVLNAPGTIDSDYRGEVKVILINHSKNDYIIRNGDRIAQMVVSPCLQADFTAELSLNQTGRGCGGFGSTGRA